MTTATMKHLPSKRTKALAKPVARSRTKRAGQNGTIHTAKRPKQPTLAELNRRLFADPDRLLRIAEANTMRLAGRPRL